VSPNKLFDYMQAGLPVVCAIEAPENPLTASGGGLVIEPDDPSAIVDAVAALAAAGPEARRDLGRRGRNYVQAHHSQDALSDLFVAAVNDRLPSARSGKR
jgi:glycosyltransferase involved in cell wall biosynthesis